jgi:sulfatase modifying factor 1
MLCEYRWLAIGLGLSVTGLACSRTPMDEPQRVTMNTIGTGGGANTGGTTSTIGNTGGGGTTSFPGGATSAGGTVASGGATSAGGTTTAGGTIASGGTTSAGGTIASGGSSGSGGTNGKGGTWGGTAPSCSGLPATCGPSGTDDCCKSLLVPGGTFDRSYDGVDYLDPNYPATVSDFYLDKYEITVGRFRVFVNAGVGTQVSPPAAGAGANPLVTGSGWDSTWNTNLAANRAALTTNLKCQSGYQTWTDTPGINESRPVNCLDWYTAFAFCAWDGGRLATEAEWNYAASGGNEQRYYPWSSPGTSTTIDDSYAVYCGGSCYSAQNVGSKSPTGDGKWGQSDLAGNVYEWTLDWYATPYLMLCNNCADLTAASSRVIRGGSFYGSAFYLRSANRIHDYPEEHYYGFGSRCARTSL